MSGKILNVFTNQSFRLKRILMSGLSGLASKGVNMLTTFFTIYVVNQHFEAERFSIYLIIISLLGMLGFADLGLGYGLFNQLAKDNNDFSKMKRSISTTYFFLCFIGLLISIASIGLLFYSPEINLFNASSPSNIMEGNKAGFVFLLIFGVTLPFTIIRKIQASFQEAYKGDLWDIAGNIASVLGFLIFVGDDQGLIFLIITMVGIKNLALLSNHVYYFYFSNKELKPTLDGVDNKILKSIFHDGMRFFFLQMIAVALNTGDTFMISRYFDARHAANYAVGYRIFTFYFVPILAIITPFLAANNNALAQRDFKWLKKSFNKTFLVLLFISSISALLYIYTTNFIITRWLGEGRILSTHFLLGFAAFIVYSNFNAIYSQMMMSYVFVKKYMIIYAMTGVVVFASKVYIGKLGSPVYFLWATVILSIIFYFIPAHLLLLKTSFGEKLNNELNK